MRRRASVYLTCIILNDCYARFFLLYNIPVAYVLFSYESITSLLSFVGLVLFISLVLGSPTLVVSNTKFASNLSNLPIIDACAFYAIRSSFDGFIVAREDNPRFILWSLLWFCRSFRGALTSLFQCRNLTQHVRHIESSDHDISGQVVGHSSIVKRSHTLELVDDSGTVAHPK